MQPVYDAYASPYVTKFTPYVSEINDVYLYPAFDTASASYEKYAQPSVQRVKAIVDSYQHTLQPHVSWVSSQLHEVYGQHLSPHTDKAYKLYHDVASSPYWAQAFGHVQEVYQVYFVPAYKRASPYINRVYDNGRYVTVVVLGPYVKEGAEVGGEWFEKNVWSWMSDMWRDYVEVQVGRIKDRLKTGNGGTE